MFTREMPRIQNGKLNYFPKLTKQELMEIQRDRQRVRKLLELKKQMQRK
jgi:hypothetical protein